MYRSCLRQTGWWRWGRKPGADGGQVIAQGTISQVADNPASRIGPVPGRENGAGAKPDTRGRRCLPMVPSICPRRPFTQGEATECGHSQRAADGGHRRVGLGKTTLILESLIPGLSAALEGKPLPSHVRGVTAEGIRQIKLIDAAPIGINVRSTVATYANVHDELRKTYAKLPLARERKQQLCFFL